MRFGYFFGADMSGVDLSGANLYEADLRNATLNNVIWNNTICPDGTNSDDNGDTCENNILTERLMETSPWD